MAFSIDNFKTVNDLKALSFAERAKLSPADQTAIRTKFGSEGVRAVLGERFAVEVEEAESPKAEATQPEQPTTPTE